jgi:hypothetical protein
MPIRAEHKAAPMMMASALREPRTKTRSITFCHTIAKRFFGMHCKWHAHQKWSMHPRQLKTVTPKGDQSTSRRAYTDVRDAHNSGLTYDEE